MRRPVSCHHRNAGGMWQNRFVGEKEIFEIGKRGEYYEVYNLWVSVDAPAILRRRYRRPCVRARQLMSWVCRFQFNSDVTWNIFVYCLMRKGCMVRYWIDANNAAFFFYMIGGTRESVSHDGKQARSRVLKASGQCNIFQF